MKTTMRVASLAAAAALALAACGSAPEETPAAGGGGGGEEAAGSDFKGCMVSDAGGFEDKSFNQSGAEGLDRAAE